MITELLLWFVKWGVDLFVSIRPAWEVHLPAGVTGLISFVASLDPILPVSEALTCMGLLLTGVIVFTSVKWTIKVLDWIFDVIP